MLARLWPGSIELNLNCRQKRPIDEPVVQYGPFVMNTMEEIGTALAECQIPEFIDGISRTNSS